MIEKIVVPLDGSMAAEAILPQVRRLLYRKDAEIILVRAVETPMVENAIVMAEELLAAAREYILGKLESLQRQGVRVRQIVRFGSPPGVILDVVEEEKATMVALATHGASGLKRLLFGSTAETVIRKSPVPVLLVRPFWSYELAPSERPESRPIRNILLPVDEPARARAELPGILEFAALFEARILLLRIVEEPGEGVDRELGELSRMIEKAGIETVRLVAPGNPVERILRTVGEEEVDLVAMATHGRSGFSRLGKGSVTEDVLRKAEVPVLVTKVASAVRKVAGRKV